MASESKSKRKSVDKTSVVAPSSQPINVEQPASDQEFKSWIDSLYSVENVTNEQLLAWYDSLRYKGFDRMAVLKQLHVKIPNRELAHQAIIVCALQGPVRASKTKLSNGLTLTSMGIPVSGAQGTQALSCQRITAATADLAAYFLKKVNVGKRLNHSCPAWLQFPSAGSITMPEEMRQSHMDFARQFSGLIGGVFNEQIYGTMALNSYLSPNLHLFD
jgi:hypothetical protein